ncbi:MFS transporter [Candidatus Roizmanbacteria bacterium]|nr:MFS transporter [Candidatus Roizmanbacteria bacterium]
MLSNIRKYYLFQFFNNLAFFSPVIVLFWQANGLSMTQIMLLQSIYSLGVVILELPTGAFADYFGKKKSLILGSSLWTVGLIGYGLSHTFWQFALGELIVGMGAAFISGADRAYIHELLREIEREKEFKKVEGKARGIIQIAQAMGNLLGGFIGSISLGLSLIATGFSTFMGFLIGFSFPRIKREPKEHRQSYIQIIKESIRLVRSNKRLLWLTLFFASFNGLVWPLIFYSQPYLQMLGIPVFFFGFIFAGFNLISALGSAHTHQFEKMMKNWTFFTMCLIIVASLLLLGLFPSIYIFPLSLLFLMFAFMNQTIITDQVLKIVPSQKAATILSFQSLVRRILYAIVGPILGVITDNFGLQNALVSYAFLIFIILIPLVITERRFSRTHL